MSPSHGVLSGVETLVVLKYNLEEKILTHMK